MWVHRNTNGWWQVSLELWNKKDKLTAVLEKHTHTHNPERQPSGKYAHPRYRSQNCSCVGEVKYSNVLLLVNWKKRKKKKSKWWLYWTCTVFHIVSRKWSVLAMCFWFLYSNSDLGSAEDKHWKVPEPSHTVRRSWVSHNQVSIMEQNVTSEWRLKTKDFS